MTQPLVRDGVSRWLSYAESPERLAAIRVGLSALLLVQFFRSSFLHVAGLPQALYEPVWFMRVFESMPGRTFVIIVQVVGAAAAMLSILGLGTTVSLPVAWLAAVFLNGMLASMGKIIHNDVVLLLTVTPILLAPVSDAWAVGRGRRVHRPSSAYGFPVRAAMFVVAGAYFFSGLAKVALSGPAWVFSDNLRWVLYASSDAQSRPNELGLFVADRPLLAVAVAAGTIAVELGFPLILVKRWLTPFFLAGVILLHAGIYLTMHLNYWTQAATALVVFTDWPALLRKRPGVKPTSEEHVVEQRSPSSVPDEGQRPGVLS